MQTLFSTIVGSKLYGIDNAESDTDIKGFGLPDISRLLGFSEHEQDEVGNGLEGKDKIESVIYSLKKFLHLISKGNPTVLEVAFAPPKFHQKVSQTGLEVCKFIRDNMISKHIFPAYRGYFQSQLKKLKNKEYDKASKRIELIEKYGYDTKFAGHAYRLGYQLSEILRIGNEFTPVLDKVTKSIVVNIRNGTYDKDEIVKALEMMDRWFEDDLKQSILPDDIDKEAINNFLVDLHTRYIKGKL